LPIDQWPAAVKQAIAGIDIEELFDMVPGEGKVARGIVRKIRFRDKAPWGRMLGEQLGLISNRVDLNHRGSIQVGVSHDQERARQIELLRAMTDEERETLIEIMERAAARIETSKLEAAAVNGNGKIAIETTATAVDDPSPRNRQ
jgi:hypothetical protein